MSLATIELNDVGPVEHLSIPIPEEGGVVVLRGANGTGKSSTIRAVERLATGRDKIQVSARDGCQRGELSGCGVTLRVGRSVTRVGELECESLDGRLSVAELVDPGLKGADENDARRVKALVQLAGVKPDVSIFHDLFDDGTTFDEVTKGKDLKTDDVLILADRIKRAIDEAARNAEGIANVEKAKAAACKEAAAGVNTSVETDDAKLQALLEDAIRHEQDLQSKFEASVSRNSEIESAKAKIQEASGDRTPVATLRQYELDARDAVVAAQAAIDKKKIEIDEAVKRLNGELKELVAESKLADEKWSSATKELGQAERFEETIAELNEVVSLGEIAGPTEQQLSDAADSVANCRASIEAGVLARQAKDKLEKSKAHQAAENAALKKSESLREAAKRVDEVLSEQIAKLGVALQVKASRLVTTTRRGVTLYADLSEGERWKIALDIAIEAVGRGGLLTIPQDAYESLDPRNRKLIAEHVAGKGVVILTAEATDGPLRSEIESLAV